MAVDKMSMSRSDGVTLEHLIDGDRDTGHIPAAYLEPVNGQLAASTEGHFERLHDQW